MSAGARDRQNVILAATWAMVAVGTVVVVAGATNGHACIGFTVVGTMALATVIDPATAAACMIVPVLAVNVSLVRR